LFAIGATALAVAATRRLELGAPPRALACAAAAAISLGASLALAITTNLHADGAAALGCAVASPTAVRLARARDPLLLAPRGSRRGIARALDVASYTHLHRRLRRLPAREAGRASHRAPRRRPWRARRHAPCRRAARARGAARRSASAPPVDGGSRRALRDPHR